MDSEGALFDDRVRPIPRDQLFFGDRLPGEFNERNQNIQRSALKWRAQGALFWELRAALSAARLRVMQNNRACAAQVLQPVYDRFTEGFDTADMKAAKALLKTLAGSACSNSISGDS